MNINAKHLAVVLTDLDFFCESFEMWWNANILPSDSPSAVLSKYLESAATITVLRDWFLDLLDFLFKAKPESLDGISEASALLWHSIKINPPHTTEGWKEVFDSMPIDPNDLVKALFAQHQEWEERLKEEKYS